MQRLACPLHCAHLTVLSLLDSQCLPSHSHSLKGPHWLFIPFKIPIGTYLIPDTGRAAKSNKENSPGRCSWAGAYVKLFSRLCTHNPIDSALPSQEVGPVVHTSNRWGSWGTEKSSNLHRITQLATRGLGLEPKQSGSRVCVLNDLAFLSLGRKQLLLSGMIENFRGAKILKR